MKSYFILIPIFLFAFFQGAFLPLNLVLLTVLFFAAFTGDERSLWVSFVSGLFLDLAQGTTFGLSAAIFLILNLFLLFYSRRFEASNRLFLASFVFMGSLLYSFIVWSSLSWGQSLILFLLTLLILFLLRFFPVGNSHGLKLKV